MFSSNTALQLVICLHAKKKYAEAIELAEQAITQYRNDGRLFEMAGLIYYAMSEQQLAIARLESATTYKPLSPISQIRLASCYWQAGIVQSALAMVDFLEQQFDRRMWDGETTIQFVLLLERVKRFKSAAKICIDLFDADPRNGHACYGIAWYRFLAGGELKDFLWCLQQAVELQPENARYRITLGHVYIESLDYQAAVETFLGLTADLLKAIDCQCCLEEMIDFLRIHDDGHSELVTRMQRRLEDLKSTQNI